MSSIGSSTGQWGKINEFPDSSIESSRTEIQREKWVKKYQNIQELWDNIKKANMHDWNTRKTREQSRRNICNNDVWEFSKINYRDQPPTNPGGSENTKQEKYQRKKKDQNHTRHFTLHLFITNEAWNSGHL